MNPLFAGPAQEANVISMKVLSGEGSGKTSDILKAIQTAVEMKDELNIKVINMSLGGPASKNGESDPINQAIKAAKEAGVTVVVAAGNDGPDRKTVGSPGNSLNAITVGAIDDNNTEDPSDDKPAEFSSRGPTPDGITKPDVMAPGVTIMAGRTHQSESAQMANRMNMMHESIRFLDEMPFEQLQKAPNALFNAIGIGDETAEKIKLFEPISDMVFQALSEATARMPESEDGYYLGMSGTSMATPIVAGVVAQLYSANPDLSPDQIQDILATTADKLPDGRLGKNTQGNGVVNPEKALLKALQTKGEGKKELVEDPLAILADMGLSLEDIIVDEGGEESAKA
jgi:subtilisin family serine protease